MGPQRTPECHLPVLSVSEEGSVALDAVVGPIPGLGPVVRADAAPKLGPSRPVGAVLTRPVQLSPDRTV